MSRPTGFLNKSYGTASILAVSKVVATAVVSLSFFGCALIAEPPVPDKHWIDEALLHDGRTIEVERTVSYNYGRGELSSALQQWPSQYSFMVNIPDTGERVRWEGDDGFNPVMLDFWDGNPYLVIVAYSIFSNLKQYGCPEIPYIFLRFDKVHRKWEQVAAKEFPPGLLRANLSFTYNGWHMKGGKRQSKEDIDKWNASGELASRNSMTRVIPTDFSSWQSRHKNQYRVAHHHDGCRHIVPSNEDPTHPQSPGQPSQAVTVEILENTLYEPEWVMEGSEWMAVSRDKARDEKCRSLVRRFDDDTDTPELRGWLLFVNDSTGTKKARYSTHVFCNADALWFFDYGSLVKTRRVIITKFTISGDFVYRLNFEKPDTPGGPTLPLAPRLIQQSGHIMQPTFRSENGYLYFEWWNTYQSKQDRRIKRSLKVRIKEPQPSRPVDTKI